MKFSRIEPSQQADRARKCAALVFLILQTLATAWLIWAVWTGYPHQTEATPYSDGVRSAAP